MPQKLWFKHFINASSGASLRALWDAGDYEAYGFYWIFLECLGRWEDAKRPGTMTINWSVLARETGWKPSKCRRVLSRISSVSQIDLEEKQHGNVTFLVPKWAELQSSWGGKREPRSEQDAGRSEKKEVRSESKEASAKVSPVSSLAKIYPDKNTHSISKKQKRDPSEISKALLDECLSIWRETLNHMGVPSMPAAAEHSMLRLLLETPSIEDLKIALFGQRFEVDGPGYRVKSATFLERFSDPRHLQKTYNLGASYKKPVWQSTRTD